MEVLDNRVSYQQLFPRLYRIWNFLFDKSLRVRRVFLQLLVKLQNIKSFDMDRFLVLILGPSSVASLGFLSPVSAVVLGWFYLNQQLSTLQFIGMVVILLSVWASQRAETRKVTLAYQR